MTRPLEPNPRAPKTWDPTPHDHAIEGSVAHLRAELANDKDVTAEFVRLAELRERVPMRIPWPTAAGHRYVAAAETSPLRAWYTYAELDHLASVVRERLDLGVWKMCYPVNPAGHGYGRQGRYCLGQPRLSTLERIEYGVADIARSLNPEGATRSLEAQHPATIRQYRRRLRATIRR